MLAGNSTGRLLGHGFFAPFRDWKWCKKSQKSRVGGVGVAKDATPFFFCEFHKFADFSREKMLTIFSNETTASLNVS